MTTPERPSVAPGEAIVRRLLAMYPHPESHPEMASVCACGPCFYNAGVRMALVVATEDMNVKWPTASDQEDDRGSG